LYLKVQSKDRHILNDTERNQQSDAFQAEEICLADAIHLYPAPSRILEYDTLRNPFQQFPGVNQYDKKCIPAVRRKIPKFHGSFGNQQPGADRSNQI
jgi:hypothetical protein